MRSRLFLVALVAAFPVVAAPADPGALEEMWHRCLRDAYAHQPAGQSRIGNERNALDECKEREDAYVAALMAHQPQTMWATLFEPLATWIGTVHR